MLAIVIAILIMVVVLMQKTFLIREYGEMAMLKSVGFSNKAIISWQTKRIALVLICGIVVGLLTATPFSSLTVGQVFKMTGATKIEFVKNPVELYLVYPIIIFVLTLLACMITMLKVRKINVQDINQAE